MMFKILVVTNLFLWLAAFASFLFAWQYPTIYGSILIAAASLSGVLSWLKRERIKVLIQKGSYRNYITHLSRIILVSLLLALINFLVFKNSSNIDLTSQNLHKLSDQTINVLKSLQQPTKITLFATRSKWDQYLTIINMYKNLNRFISIEAIDSETSPQLVKIYNVQKEGTIIIEQENRKVQGVLVDELSFTNLFIKLMRDKKIVIYYTTGHGEVDLKDESKEGGMYLRTILKQNLYDLREINLLENSKIPADADMLMMLGPEYGILQRELLLIKDYINSGGNIYIGLSPQFTENRVKNLHDFLLEYNVRFENGVVVDRLAQMQGTNATIPMVKEFSAKHPATKQFEGRVIYPLTGALLFEKTDTQKVTPLFYSASFPSSWTEMDLEGLKNGNATWDAEDLKGPVPLALSIEDNKTYSKMIISGSSSYMVNGYKNQSPNFNLFLNLVSWLVDDDGIKSLNRPGLKDERIIISDGQANLIFYFSICFLPLFFFGLGAYFYRRRQKL